MAQEVSAAQAAQALQTQLLEHLCFMLAVVVAVAQLVAQVEALLVATDQILL
jgi:hypothetical protein